MITNTNPDTGIRYGVASLNNLAEWVFDEFFHNGRNLSYEGWAEENAEEIAAAEESGEEIYYESDEDTYELEIDGMQLGLSTLGGAYNVWVFLSPHTANHALCSPCCPNAGNIDSPGDFTCYTLPADWFENERG